MPPTKTLKPICNTRNGIRYVGHHPIDDARDGKAAEHAERGLRETCKHLVSAQRDLGREMSDLQWLGRSGADSQL